MKVGILTREQISDFSFEVLNSVLKNSPKSYLFYGIIDASKGKSAVHKLKRNIKKGRGFFVAILFTKFVFTKTFKLFGISRTNNRRSSEILVGFGIKYLVTTEPYSELTYNFIRNNEIDVLVYLGGFGIMVKKPLLEITPLGILSYHHGDMRLYRGQPAVFWEIYNSENKIGVVVQKLAVGLDCGEIFAEKQFDIKPFETFSDVKRKVYSGSVEMMSEALSQCYMKKNPPIVVDSFGKIYTLPNFRQWIVFQLKNFLRFLRKLTN